MATNDQNRQAKKAQKAFPLALKEAQKAFGPSMAKWPSSVLQELLSLQAQTIPAQDSNILFQRTNMLRGEVYKQFLAETGLENNEQLFGAFVGAFARIRGEFITPVWYPLLEMEKRGGVTGGVQWNHFKDSWPQPQADACMGENGMEKPNVLIYVWDHDEACIANREFLFFPCHQPKEAENLVARCKNADIVHWAYATDVIPKGANFSQMFPNNKYLRDRLTVAHGLKKAPRSAVYNPENYKEKEDA